MTDRDQHDIQTRTEALNVPAFRGPHVLVMWEDGFVRKPLEEGTTVVIGRGEDCDVQVIHPSLSRRHVAVHGGNPPRVEDLGSTNGVRCGQKLLEPGRPVPLSTGEMAQAGPVIIAVQGTVHAPVASGSSPPMSEVRQLLTVVAKSGISVLLLGETGVGKEVAAAFLHQNSARGGRKFLTLNCAAFTESLLESELLGHERGAFTGAERSKPGLIEDADGGTIFLDEVAEIPPATQVKLLRVLDNREVRRIGALASRAVDVRFVSATNRDLHHLVASGTFREDLYYRLNGMTIRIPPLRERCDEIPELVNAFVDNECKRTSRASMRVDAKVWGLLERHSWPGNIRELRNVVERSLALATGATIGVEHIVLDPAPGAGPSAPLPSPSDTRSSGARSTAEITDLRSNLAEYERGRILDALAKAEGNQTKAAKLLGLTRRALIGRIEAYNLPRPRKR